MILKKISNIRLGQVWNVIEEIATLIGFAVIFGFIVGGIIHIMQ